MTAPLSPSSSHSSFRSLPAPRHIRSPLALPTRAQSGFPQKKDKKEDDTAHALLLRPAADLHVVPRFFSASVRTVVVDADVETFLATVFSENVRVERDPMPARIPLLRAGTDQRKAVEAYAWGADLAPDKFVMPGMLFDFAT